MTAFYNDVDAKACAWMRQLITDGQITPGTVDERSISELRGRELSINRRVHFFAGIGGWDYALKLAGWPDDRVVWTGSCPCQPFSSAGKRQGHADERHLWPEMLRLIAECRPPIVFGEQVASALGRDWLAGVRADLEALGYAVGAADLCAACVGAPHLRQRLYWCGLADAERERARAGASGQQGSPRLGRRGPANGGDDGGLGHTAGDGRDTRRAEPGRPVESADASGLVYADGAGSPRRDGAVMSQRTGEWAAWSPSAWHPCRDGKRRRIPLEPEFFPLAHGLPARVVRLRGYGNAIVPQVAAAFVRAVMEVVL